MGTNYIAPIWRMPRNANKDKLSNYSIDTSGTAFINCGNSDILDLITSNHSISTWVKYTTTANQVVCEKGTNDELALQIGGTGFNGYIAWIGGPDYVVRSANAINDGNWHHICCVANGTSSTLYIDGQISATGGSKIQASANSSDFHIGGRATSYGFDGSISQLCLFDYALDSSQVNYLYNLNNPMAITGAEPVAYYPLGDNSNPNAPGSYPNISVGADSVFDFDGAIGGALINVGNDSSLNITDSLSVSAWFKTLNNSDTIMIATKDNGGASRAWQLYMHSTGAIRFGINGVTALATSSGVYDDGNWHHVLGVYEPSNYVKLYIDGLEDGEDTTSVPASINSLPSQDVVIGGYDGYDAAGGRRWDGELSNIQIWDTDLQLSDAQTLYNNGQPLMTGTQPQAANLKAWYKLNQSANWEADSSGNWQIPDAVSAYPQSFDFGEANTGGEYINAPINIGGFTKCSFSVWLNPSTVNAVSTIFATNITNNFSAYFGYNTIYVKVDYNNSIYAYIGSISNYINVDKWNHLSIIYDGTFTDSDTATQNAGRLKMYINGSYISFSFFAGTIPSSIPVSGSDSIRIGTATPTTDEFGGELSNFTIYDTNLSALQVETLYNNGTPLTTAIATDNLKAWYKLNDNEKFDGTDWSVENQKYPAGFDSALDFNGTSDHITLPTITLADDWSVSVWMRHPTLKVRAQCVGTSTGSGFFAYSGQIVSGGSIQGKLAYYNGVAYIPLSNNRLDDGNWHHWIITYKNSTTTLKCFVDGEENYNDTYDAGTGNTINRISNTFASNYWKGELSNIAIFNTDLDSPAITALYNNGTPETTISSSPISWWKLNNTTTGIQDSVGSNNGTNSGATKVNTFVSTEAATSSGMTEQNLVNNNVSALNGESSGMDTTNLVTSNLTRTQPYSSYSFNFDAAISDYISIPNPGSIFAYGESAFTFSGWVGIDAYTDQDGIFGRFEDTNNRATIKLTFNSPFNGLMFQTVKSGVSAYTRWNGILPDPANGEWKHICLTYDAANIKVYVNGADQGAGVITGTMPTTMPNLSAATPLEIARDAQTPTGSNPRVLNGRTSNFCVFDRALTESEILKIYNNGVPQDLQATSSFSNNILGWWPMDQRSSYYDGTDWVVRDLEGGKDGNGINTGNVEDLVGSAPGSEASGTGSNLTIADLKNNMKDSTLNAHSINMGDYADGVTNPANSGRSTDVP